MKSLLSENMLRFGTKNLPESAKRALTLESIIQTIYENGLASAVKSRLNEAYTANHWIEYTTNTGSDTYNYVEIQFTVAAAGKLGWSTLYYTGGKKDADRKIVYFQYPKTIRDVKSLQTYVEAGKGTDERLVFLQPNNTKKYNADAKAALEPMKTSYSYKNQSGKLVTVGPFANPDNWYQMVCEAAIAGATA